ncbi:MAG: tetratricopeptide repeat protein [Candidatus Methanofastidiosum sp.]|nr:tetratricopeptide repeat protein [Methanofastidiosum sp.]
MIGKFCLNCGAEIPRDSIYCPKCGAEFQKTGLPKEETSTYGKTTQKTKINQKMILGVFGIIALVVIAAFVLSSFSPKTVTYDNEGQNSAEVGNTLSAMDYYNEGVSLYDQGRYDEAIIKFERALEIDPTNKEAWAYKGISLDDIGRYSDALFCYDKAIAIDPYYIVPWYNKGILIGNQGQYLDAITCFDRVISIDPNDGGAWYNKGIALELLGRNAEAQACFNKAKELGYTG